MLTFINPNPLNTVPADVGSTITMRGYRNGQRALVISTYYWPNSAARVVRFDDGKELAVQPSDYRSNQNENTNQ
jgi:hypothetical protein